jgi:hypothetical protein
MALAAPLFGTSEDGSRLVRRHRLYVNRSFLKQALDGLMILHEFSEVARNAANSKLHLAACEGFYERAYASLVLNHIEFVQQDQNRVPLTEHPIIGFDDRLDKVPEGLDDIAGYDAGVFGTVGALVTPVNKLQVDT